MRKFYLLIVIMVAIVPILGCMDVDADHSNSLDNDTNLSAENIDNEATISEGIDNNDDNNDINDEVLSSKIKILSLDVKYINDRYKEIYSDSMVIARLSMMEDTLEDDHVDMMIMGSVNYQNLAELIDIKGSINYDDFLNAESLHEYFRHMSQASISMGEAFLYFIILIEDRIYGTDIYDSNTSLLSEFLEDAERLYDKAMIELDKFAESNGIEF